MHLVAGAQVIRGVHLFLGDAAIGKRTGETRCNPPMVIRLDDKHLRGPVSSHGWTY